MSVRYAIYFAPEAANPLWAFGSAVLGYDAESGLDRPHPTAGAVDWTGLTEEPRRYGFHATLKAPFLLAEGQNEAALIEAAERFAASQARFSVGKLLVAELGHFLALVPRRRNAALHRLADQSVEAFEPFRAPIEAADLARRLQSPLSERQIRHLERYGYPYVFEDFRFHMTLTGSLEMELRKQALETLSGLYTPIDGPVSIDAISLFVQENRQARFRMLKRFAFSD